MPKNSRKNRPKKKPTVYLEAEAALEREFDARQRSALPDAQHASDKDLFFIDKQKQQYKSSEEKKKAYALKLTRADKALASNPRVPDVKTAKPLKRKMSDKALREADAMLENKRVAEQSAPRKKQKVEPLADLWDTPAAPKVPPKFAHLANELISQNAKKKPHTFRSKHPVASLQIPQPGQSYRPAFEAHQASLALAITEANTRNNLEEGAAEIIEAFENAKKGDYRLRVDIHDKPPQADPNAEVPEKPKDKKKKKVNKEKLEKRKVRKILEEKASIQAKISEDIDRLPHLLEKLEKTAARREEEKAIKQAKKEAEKLRPPSITSKRFEEPLNPVAFTEQIPKRFSHNKTLFNPLTDRFHSLQRTGRVRPKIEFAQQHISAYKVVEKHSSKRYDEEHAIPRPQGSIKLASAQ